MMNTKEVSEYLGIHEKQVYALIKSKKIPCTRVTGKWLFMKDAIDEWLRLSMENNGRIKNNGIILASGSNDPVLDILLNYTKQHYPDFRIFSNSTGSTEGLRLMDSGITDIAWCHLIDPESRQYNIPYITSLFSGRKVTVVHLFYRELGFISSGDSPKKVENFEDLTSQGIKFINRQKGSGTRVLLDQKITEYQIKSDSIKGYEDEVYTHIEVGLSIISGNANAGIGTVAVARLFGLDFVPIVKESFDMVLDQTTFFNDGIQAFIASLNSDGFKDKVKLLGDYDFSDSGRIVFSVQ